MELHNNDKLTDNYNYALKLEQTIAELTDSNNTFIQLEYAPADDEEEFMEDMKHHLKK